jgi:hypothetical protein
MRAFLLVLAAVTAAAAAIVGLHIAAGDPAVIELKRDDQVRPQGVRPAERIFQQAYRDLFFPAMDHPRRTATDPKETPRG